MRPEELVGFRSFVAVPRGTQGHEYRRGQVTIDLFGLNLRDELILERCNLIRAMWPYLDRHRTGNPAERDDAARELDALTRPSAQHANCARCFRSLYVSEPALTARASETGAESTAHGSASATSSASAPPRPTATTRYCLPSWRYVIGLPPGIAGSGTDPRCSPVSLS